VTPNTWTTSDLISLIKILGHIPQSNATFVPAQLLTLADLELRTSIARILKETNEGYFQTIVEHDQNATGLYPVPSDAIGATTYVIQIRSGQTLWPVSRQEVAEMTTTNYPSTANYTFFIRANTINVLPIQFQGSLRITYERRPSTLVPVTSCAQVTAIVGQVITVSSLPTGWLVDDTLDLQSAQPQFDLVGQVAISAINSLDITVVGDVSLLSVGDYLTPEGQSCIPQIPVEFHALLAQRVVCKVYELQGYLDKLKAAKDVLLEMQENLVAIITPRTTAAPKVINPSWGGRKPGNSWSQFNPPAEPSGS
jgi:hypothetical protein